MKKLLILLDSCIPLVVGILGFIILGAINPLEHRQVAYFATFLLTMGVSIHI